MSIAVFFEITDVCNLACSFCCKTWRTYKSNTMSYEDIDLILSIDKNHGKITGGEPGCVKDKVFYYIERETVPISMNSNLSLWTQDEIREIKAHNVMITANIASLRWETHHAITGIRKEEHDNILSNLRYLNPRTDWVTIVVNDLNKDTFARDTLTFHSRWGIRNFLLSPMIYNDRQAVNYEDLTPAVERFYRDHRNLNIRTVGQIQGCCIPPSHSCTAGLNRFVVLSNKDVVPCAWNNKNILGNLDRDTLDSICEKGREYWNSFPFNERPLCKGYLENKMN